MINLIDNLKMFYRCYYYIMTLPDMVCQYFKKSRRERRVANAILPAENQGRVFPVNCWLAWKAWSWLMQPRPWD